MVLKLQPSLSQSSAPLSLLIMINQSNVHCQSLQFSMMEEYGRKEYLQLYIGEVTCRSCRSRPQPNLILSQENLGPLELFYHQSAPQNIIS
ncbi:beta glucosidase 8 [Perilla frutescens var. hirtella]|uniref:Beta glucosidase 8 n=1 Tax=Perilla frutescens var. hirtella TaxID=608512 RepID=A0AAD4ISK8_PERFH|nr:beta glucosidase 8 [Perilla frutescens var. frutescens]KAH6783461.1 beta glucosidase 8 [Perilla frutescens var. hirtella]KAH6820519.1 beta glucosidase 8 [Perilla frutescens var. hirtella]